jgi:hypothetical protein
MNEQLCRDFSEKEISDALFQIGPIKAPGPDGFPARFYQRNWELLKPDIIVAVKKFFATGHMPEGTNDTYIVLIPKVDNPVELKEYRPIGLCNVLYKIVSKCLVNRLCPLLGEVISENQSAFVPGRIITDNILVAYECLHTIKNNKKRKSCLLNLTCIKHMTELSGISRKECLSSLGFIWNLWSC